MNEQFWRVRRLAAVVVLLSVAALGACSKSEQEVSGFVLPEGDPEMGREVFASVGCRYCHTVAGVEFPPFEAEPVFDIVLGGQVTRVQSYGELLNSVVNPNHTISTRNHAQLQPEEMPEGRSPMPVFNDVLTVRQLIDLTAFLHSRYELLPRYRGYSYVR